MLPVDYVMGVFGLKVSKKLHTNKVGVVRRKKLTVSLSISNTFIPGPLSSIIFEMYCFTARITFIVI